MAIDSVTGVYSLIQNNYGARAHSTLSKMDIKEETALKTDETIGGKEEVREAAEKLIEVFEPSYRNFKFELHDKLDEYYVTIVDSMTNEVIKEIPPKELLDMYAAMAEHMGILLDKKI